MAAAAAFLFVAGVDHLNAEELDTAEGRTAAWCEAVEAFKGAGGVQVLDAHVFSLRNPLNGLEVLCGVSTERNDVASQLDALQFSTCSFEDTRVVCSNLTAVIPGPEHTKGYELELYSQHQDSSSRSLVGSFTFDVAKLLQKQPPRDDSNGKSQGEKDSKQWKDCKEKGGEPKQVKEQHLGDFLTSQWVECLLLFQLRSAQSGRGPCYVMSSSGASGGFGWSGSMWHGLFEQLQVSDWDSRLIKPQFGWDKEPDMQVRGPPEEEKYSAEALRALLEQGSAEFRLDGDPVVQASRMTDSSFDFGWSAAEKAKFGIIILVGGSVFACCSLGACIKAFANG